MRHKEEALRQLQSEILEVNQIDMQMLHQIEEQLVQLRRTETDEDQQEAIRELESDLLDVEQIFRELATLEHDQVDRVDSREASTESSSSRVTEGTKKLKLMVQQIEERMRVSTKEDQAAGKQLESDFLDVKQMYRDLAGMVNEQTDPIEGSNATSLRDNAHATEQLRRSSEYKTKKMKCVIL